MVRPVLSILALAAFLCLGCTQTFGPSRDDAGADAPGDDASGVDAPGADSPVWDVIGPDIPPADVPPGVDSVTPDAAPPQTHGPLFQVWITGGASSSKNNAVRVIGGIQPAGGVPSGDGAYWLIPVFRAGPSANDS